jgi:peptidoglycan/xylan/chitin deacetylase (PgdA/CDA1 family)
VEEARTNAELTLPPRPFELAKAALTRGRSLVWALRVRGRPAPGLRILFYHRVADAADALAVPPARFREHMEILADAGLAALDVVEAVARLRRGELSGGAVALSFDDGYRDVAENALPVLRELGFRATVFVATGVVDGTARMSWYRQQPPVLAWDEIRELDAEGVLRFEPHSVTHPNLLALGDHDAGAEIAGSKRALEERVRRRASCFCYPAGLFGPRERRLVAAAGFDSAVTCEPGVSTEATDPFLLRRTQIERRDRRIDFRAKIDGAHDSPLPLREAFRRFRYRQLPAR